MERPILKHAVTAAALFAAAAAGCTQVNSDFVCQTDVDCTQADGTTGRCESDQRCSYSDTDCASGFRYGGLAGDESNACTGDGGSDGSDGSGSNVGSDLDACVVAEVRAGVHDTCVRRTDGSVWCFGDGASAATDAGFPAGTIAQLDNGGAGRCARYSDGSLDCTTGPITGKLTITGRELAIGSTHACAITDGHIDCWGTNASGELGTGGTTASTTPADAIAVNNAVHVSAGLAATCEVESTGELWCWGDNSRNQLGQTIITIDHAASPVEVFVPNGASTLAMGDQFACSASTTGAVVCWGDETKGETSQTGSDTASLVTVPGLSGIAQVTAGGSHACALASDGHAWCWGDNAAHESSASSAAIVTTPAAVVDRDGTPLLFLDLDAGAQHTCGRLAPHGDVVCWGFNGDGEIGDGTTTTAQYPTPSTLGCP